MQTQASDGSVGTMKALTTRTTTATATTEIVDAIVADSVVLDFGPFEVLSFPLWKNCPSTPKYAVAVDARPSSSFAEAC